MVVFPTIAEAWIAKMSPAKMSPAPRTTGRPWSLPRLLLGLILVLLAGCTLQIPPPTSVAGAEPRAPIVEQPVTVIPLNGPPASPKAQLSGLAWYGDHLILLLQYPNRFEHQLFYLEKQDIVNFLRGDAYEPLTPYPIPLLGGDLLVAQTRGFQGLEAIAFAGERVFLTVEAEVEQQMMGYLVSGDIAPDLSAMRLDPTQMTEIAPQTPLRNLSEEALVLAGEQIVTLHEANGLMINWSPVAHVFNSDDLQPVGTMPFPQIDYRITDATPLDEANRFWAINAFFPLNDSLKLGSDSLAAKYGVGTTHRMGSSVERLVEFQYTPSGITLVDAPPLQLQLLDDTVRNWEGIARLDSPEFNGFLLVTDTRPDTILAFVPLPQE